MADAATGVAGAAGAAADATGAVAGAPGSSPGAVAGANGASDWLGGVSDDVRGHILGKGYKGVAELAAAYVSAEKLIGADKVAIPGKSAGPEEWAALYGKLGRPEKPEGYELKKPDNFPGYADDTANWFKNAAHKHGLSQRQAAALHDEFIEFLGGALSRQETEGAERAAAAKAALEKAWGADKVAANLELANRVVRSYPGLAEELKDLGLQNAPGLAQALALLGDLTLKEDDLVTGTAAGGAPNTPEAAKAALERLSEEAARDPKHPLLDASHPDHRKTVARQTELYKLAYPGKASE